MFLSVNISLLGVVVGVKKIYRSEEGGAELIVLGCFLSCFGGSPKLLSDRVDGETC